MAQPEEQVSAADIERKRSKWAQRQRDKHRRFFKRLRRLTGFSFHTSSTFMRYLHGDVPRAEAESAWGYEFARESREMWQVAHAREKLFTKGWRTPDGRLQRLQFKEAALIAMRLLYWSASKGYYPPWAQRFLFLRSFPHKDWLELSGEERQEFARPPRVAPLPMTDVLTLEALGVFDKFKEMAKVNNPVIEVVPPGKMGRPMLDVEPLLQSYKEQPLYRALFDVDFSKTKNQLVNEFKEWLDLPANLKRLEEWRKPTVDPTSNALDRLKDLAAFRLFRALENDWNAANDFAGKHRLRLNPKEPRAFRDAKAQVGRPRNESALFGDEAAAYKAQASAWACLEEVMPQEFRPLSEGMAKVFVQLERLASKQ